MDFRKDILPHRDRLFRLAFSITLNRADAEDIVQETMLRVWEKREAWKDINNVEAWLTQICKNLALDHRKHAEISRPVDSQQPQADNTSFDKLEATDAVTIVSRLMNELPSPQDEIVRLREIEGLSYREIATRLNLSEDQVRVHLHRARAKLRNEYLRIHSFGL